MDGRKYVLIGTLTAGMAVALFLAPASAQGELELNVESVRDGGIIPNRHAFCLPTAQGDTKVGPNINPSISWPKGPRGTNSYAVILYGDTHPPKEQPEKTRQTFYHWVLVDIPANTRWIPEGAETKGRLPRGTKIGVSGISDSTTRVFAANEQLKDDRYGYKGPCPWNDENIHHLHFKVYALSVPSLRLGATFDGAAAMEAMQGNILAQGEVLGLYLKVLDPIFICSRFARLSRLC